MRAYPAKELSESLTRMFYCGQGATVRAYPANPLRLTLAAPPAPPLPPPSPATTPPPDPALPASLYPPDPALLAPPRHPRGLFFVFFFFFFFFHLI